MQSILITGANGGMGCAAVQLFAQQGFRVFALDRTPGDARENVTPIQADITSEESILDAVRQVQEQTDSLYAIVHFAGVYMLNSLVEMETADRQKGGRNPEKTKSRICLQHQPQSFAAFAELPAQKTAAVDHTAGFAVN